MRLVALLALALLPGCALVDMGDIEGRAVQYAGKYCELAPSTRLAIRKRVNTALGEMKCAVVQCEGDAPVSCPFLSTAGDTN